MSQFSSLDRESFQKFLANAYAVQQSQMDSHSLSVIIEVQRLITRGDLDVDGALRLIVDRTQDVANATGVAIGLLHGDQLVYRAGSGSATTYIGRSVTARLVVSTESKTNREILRVENAETDARIEAAICRQFGANSLLILLIYHDQAVAGVLEVFFSEAHSFQDREVRTYRLMAGLAGEAVSRTAQVEQNTAVTAEPPVTERAIDAHAIDQTAPPLEKVLNPGGSLPGPANEGAIYEPREAAGEWALRRPAVTATIIRQLAKRVSWYNRRWNLPLGAVVTALVLICGIAYSHRRPASPFGPQRSVTTEHQAPLLPPRAASTKDTSTLQTPPVQRAGPKAAKSGFRRVQVGENEVDYIKEDVTVRYFTHKPAPHGVRVGKNEVAYIGDDVTVRYFMRKPAAVSPTRPTGGAVQPAGSSWPEPAKPLPSKPAK